MTARGPLGARWVAAQAVLFAVYLLVPRITLDLFDALWIRVVGWALVAIGAVAALSGAAGLGRKLTPFPRPREGAKLITTGWYGIVRHPIYFGVILIATGWAMARNNGLQFAAAAGLVVFFDQKTRFEEQMLTDEFPQYGEYRTRVKKLIPWIY